MTQILASLGKDGCVNLRQGLDVISAYTDTWKDTMTARFNYQEERILGLESQLLESRNTVGKYKESFTRFRKEVTRLNDLIDRHERAFPKIRGDVETSLEKVNFVLNNVEDRMKEFLTWINHLKQSNLNEEIPVDIVSSLQEIIQDISAASSVESMRAQVEEMSRDMIHDRSITSNLQSIGLDLQEKLDEVPMRNFSSSLMGSREDLLAQYQEYQEGCISASESSNHERDIVRKGIERAERQISQLSGAVISKFPRIRLT